MKHLRVFAIHWPLWAVLTGLVVAAVNLVANLESAGLSLDYGVFLKSAGFDVSERLIPYAPTDSYARVILTGFLNTLLLAILSGLSAHALGVLVGWWSIHPSWSIRALAIGCVEMFRNLPKILWLLVLYILSVQWLPPVTQAIEGFGVVLSNRALSFPTLTGSLAQQLLCLALVGVGLGVAVTAQQFGRTRGRAIPATLVFFCLCTLLIGLLYRPIGLVLEAPVRQGFDYVGGGRVSLQFLVMWACLTLYHGAQIAEVVRGGLRAVPAGTREAGLTLGLTERQIRREIIWPQTQRIIFPSLGNQYVNLFKNTSIAIAVGYSDLMSVTGTMINQTFRPLEAMTVTIALYMGCCLLISWVLNQLQTRSRVH